MIKDNKYKTFYINAFDTAMKKYDTFVIGFSNSDMIYAARFLLNMCFPIGITKTEESGQGKAYRIEIINKKK